MISNATRYTDGTYILAIKCMDWNEKTESYDNVTDDLFAPDVIGYDRNVDANVIRPGTAPIQAMIDFAKEWRNQKNSAERYTVHEIYIYSKED